METEQRSVYQNAERLVPDDRSKATDPATAKRVSSLTKGLTVLRALAAINNSAGVSQLSRTTGFAKSTVHRLLTDMSDFGIVRQVNDGRYEIGILLFELGSRARAGFDLRATALPHLQRLRDETSETAYLGVGADKTPPDMEGGVIYIEKVESTQAIRMTSELGRRNPLYCTSLGKALLAFSDEELIERFLSETALLPRTPNTITEVRRMGSELARVKRQGFAVDDEEMEVGCRCIGAPVFAEGRVVAAVSIAGPTTRVTADSISHLADAVTRAAGRISTAIGATGTTPSLGGSNESPPVKQT